MAPFTSAFSPSSSGRGYTPGQPIIPDLSTRIAQIQNKFSSPNDPALAAALASSSPATRQALLRLDLERVARGSDPYTARQSTYGLTAATTNLPVTPEPEQSLFGNAIGDLSTFIRGIPHLPFAVFDDIKNTPGAIANVPSALAEGSSPLQSLGNVANLPGFRLLPGSFILGAAGDDVYMGADGKPTTTKPVNPNAPVIAGGGWDTLASHPLFTALDALPYASKAAKLTSTYRGVEGALAEQARLLNNPIPRSPRPIPTLLKNLGGNVEQVKDLRAGLIDQAITSSHAIPERGLAGLDPANPIPGPIVNPGPLGRGTARTAARFGGSSLGKWIQDARSPLSRATAERGLYHTASILDPQVAATLDPTSAKVFHSLGAELTELGKDISKDRMADIYRGLTHDDATILSTLTPEESLYVQRFRDGTADLRRAQVIEGHSWLNSRSRRNQSGAAGLIEVPFPHGTEVFDARTGSRVLDARYAADKTRWFREQASHLTSNTPYSLTSLKHDARGVLADRHLSPADARAAARILLTRARKSGLDVSREWNALSKAQTRAHIDPILSAISDRAYNPAVTTPLNVTQVIDDARAVLSTLRSDPVASSLYSAMSKKNLNRSPGIAYARNELTKMMARKVHGRPPFDPVQLRAAFDTLAADRKVVTRLRTLGHTDSTLKSLDRYTRLVEQRALPARFDDLTREAARNSLIREITDRESAGLVSAEVAAQAIDAASTDFIARVEQLMPSLASDGTINRVLSEARDSWQQLAAQGLSPTWVHRVTPDQASRAINPRVFDNPSISPGQLKARLWDPAPSMNDLTISLHHQAYELLNRAASKNFADEMSAWYGVSGAELQTRLRPIANQLYARDPSKSPQAHLAALIDREWTSYDPATFLRGKGQNPRVRSSSAQTYIPRSVAATLDRMRPTLPSTLERGLSGPMRVFRTSVLPLSPRWHLNNIVGGAIMLSSIASPKTFGYIMKAYDLAKNGGEELARIKSPTGKAAMPPGQHLRELNEWAVNRKLHDPTGVATAHSLAAGHTIGRILRDVRDSQLAQQFGRGFNRVTEASYAANGFVDNMNRSMAYLTGQDRALSRGLSRSEAIDAGIQTARDALQSWDRLTPIERSGMRMVFPFYSWTSHLLRFVLQYPHDHPWRVSIMSRIAETELADQQTGLPERFASLFTPFGIDAQGNAMGVTLDSANPFRDVTNYALLAGFMVGQEGGNVAALTSGMNPFIGTVLEAAGFDSFRGSPDLYPELAYDPNTGQLSAGGGGALPVLALNNFLPQSELLTSLAGANRDFKQLARTNPDAAARQLRGAMGLPNLTRRFNVPEEQIKAEVTRMQAMSDVTREALRTGNLDLIDAYPVLSAYRSQVEKLGATGQLADQQTGTSKAYADLERAGQSQVDALTGAGGGGGLVDSALGLLGF